MGIMAKYLIALFLYATNCFSMQKEHQPYHWFSLTFSLPEATKDHFVKLLTEKNTWKIDQTDIIINDRNSFHRLPISDSQTIFELQKHFFKDALFEKAGSKPAINVYGNIKNILSHDYFPGRNVCKCIGGTRSELLPFTRTNDHQLEELLAGIRSKKLEIGTTFKDAYGDGYMVKITPDSQYKPSSFSLDFFTYFLSPWKAKQIYYPFSH